MKTKVNKKLLQLIAEAIVTYILMYMVCGLCWVGAEHVLEGAVSASIVDSIVNGILCLYLTSSVMKVRVRMDKLESAVEKSRAA